MMEPKVLRTSPSVLRAAEILDSNGIFQLSMVDIDKDESPASIMFVRDNVASNEKGKGIYQSSNHQLKETLASCSFTPDVEILASANEVQSNSTSASYNLIDLDDHCSDLSCEDDEGFYPFHDDSMDVDDYSALQTHFDNMDIPPDIEAPIPWLPEAQVQSGSSDKRGKSPADFELKHTSRNTLSWQAKINGVNHSSEVDGPFDVTKDKRSATSSYSKKSVSPHEVSYINSLVGDEGAKSRWYLDPYKRNKRFHNHPNDSSFNPFDAMKLHNVDEPYFGTSDSVKMAGSHNVPYSNFPVYMDLTSHPPEIGPSVPHWSEYYKTKMKKPFSGTHTGLNIYDPSDPLYLPLGEVLDKPWVPGSIQNQVNVAAGSSTSETTLCKDLDELLRNFEQFKQFETVEDHSDHYYTSNGVALKLLSKKWAKRIQEDWKMLEEDLPDTIFVRVYESRMDLLRAVIIGAEGTPYHDGLFFFDVYFPPNYPDVPPHVYYHSGGLRLNPNLYESGKVCLSLLNTWTGSVKERWIPGMSTMLQVLVSIQGLILNAKPYFNEPGYACQSGSSAGESRSQRYNEDAFLLSIKTMVYNIRRPPKHFQDFVHGHFCKKAEDILVACKAYVDGAQVGSLVKGGVQDLDVSDKSCSLSFKHSLVQHLIMLVESFKQIGVRDCEKLLPALPSLPALPTMRMSRHHGKATEVKNGNSGSDGVKNGKMMDSASEKILHAVHGKWMRLDREKLGF